ncbi:SDR family oxidoreductase [Silvimonas sp. JCM 19000]
MSASIQQPAQPTLLLIGASRGLGLAMATEFLQRNWHVTATVRGTRPTPLHELADQHANALQIEQLDITLPEQIAALRERLAERQFDMLFVNAGTANTRQDETIADISTDEFVRVMLTNTLGPMRVVEALQHQVKPDGLIGVMSSGQGSITNNEKGGHEVYRGSKAALNQYMRSYAARHAGEPRALLLMAPGWIRTELGGPDAPFGVAETMPAIVDVLLAKRARPGLEYLDRNHRVVPW